MNLEPCIAAGGHREHSDHQPEDCPESVMYRPPPPTPLDRVRRGLIIFAVLLGTALLCGALGFALGLIIDSQYIH